MTDSAPKPGPHLSPSARVPGEPFVPFRDRAREHAANARTILSDQGDDVTASTDDFLAAIAEALTSLAYTQMAPPARRRPKCNHGVQVVTR